MELIKLEDLNRFLAVPVQVGIQDIQGEERAPFLQKTIKKLQICPDHTHLRIYFDDVKFFAIPLDAAITESANEWTAYDHHSGLNYIIKRENGYYD
ncbi:hypothetical protein JMM81_05165 [Bacillus sp. V3B]|uniref:hypothetical protein n=1 Tax=Bacillus sp. V3B TaxID=2804915 RepID=UPI00210EF5E5|nr:hypothetical protein [Bacillus sp. V3B]MCQ6274368.1 hypothetical protein [Bacillus sp. V3B]